jgi:hypothetical protein
VRVTNLDAGTTTLAVGQTAEFDIGPGRKSEEAKNVPPDLSARSPGGGDAASGACAQHGRDVGGSASCSTSTGGSAIERRDQRRNR